MRNDLPRGATIEILLLKVVESLSTLVQNPDISAKIKEAYALDETEKQAFDQANQVIANADNLRLELSKEAQKYADIKNMVEQEEILRQSNLEMHMFVKEQTAANEKEALVNKKKLEELEMFSKNLDRRDAELKEFSTFLKSTEQEIEKQRQEIKDALDKSKLILGGLG